MLRYVLLLAVAVLSLSCASGGQSSADSRTISYVVSCHLCRASFLDSEGRMETYIRQDGYSGQYWHFKRGQLALLKVERTPRSKGYFTAYIYNGPIVAADTLRHGETGPLQLEYVVE